MSNITLPPQIQDYFSAKGGDAGAAAACFTSDAVVCDVGEDLELRGTDQIRAWLSRTSSEYKMTSEVRSATESEGRHVVSVVISGDFPGSPYEFAYRFLLEGDKIRELTIDPIGSLA